MTQAPPPFIVCLILLTLSLPLACSPAIVHLPEPDWTPLTTSGPTVRVHFPTDIRPPSERRDGRQNSAIYPVSIPVQEFHYGDDHLRPNPLVAIWQNAQSAIYQSNHPLSRDDGEIHVRLHVLHHRGTRDISDAQWISTLTGGLAGTVGKFFYPIFTEVHLQVRVQVQDARGHTLAVRDVIISEIERKPVAHVYGFWSAYQRNIVAEMYERAFSNAHNALSEEIALIVDQTLSGQPLTAGSAITDRAQHALHRSWERDDSLDFRGRAGRDTEAANRIAALKYGSERFSLTTGHDLIKGDAVGRLALPHDTVGYDIGLTDRIQGQLNLTLLGKYNSVGGGLRAQVIQTPRSRYSLELGYHPYFIIDRANRFKPDWVGRSFDAGAVWSWRKNEITWYTKAGVQSRLGRRDVPELNIAPATTVSLVIEPGLELQLTQTLMIALSVRTRADFRDHALLTPDAVNAFSPIVPILALGFR